MRNPQVGVGVIGFRGERFSHEVRDGGCESTRACMDGERDNGPRAGSSAIGWAGVGCGRIHDAGVWMDAKSVNKLECVREEGKVRHDRLTRMWSSERVGYLGGCPGMDPTGGSYARRRSA